MKEATGHKSDAVDAYQVTGEHQRKLISNVVQSNLGSKSEKNEDKCSEVSETKVEVECSCIKAKSSVDVGEILKQVMSANSKKGKTIVRMEIEIDNG